MRLRVGLVLLAHACAVAGYGACPAGVSRIADTLLLADGVTAARGTIAVRGPQAPSGVVVSSTIPVTIGAGGAVDFCLAGGPGWKYDATFALVDPATGKPTDQFPERWIVPKTSTVQTLAMLRGGSSAPQFLVSPQQLNPAGYSPGQGPVWDGTSWVPGSAGSGGSSGDGTWGGGAGTTTTWGGN